MKSVVVFLAVLNVVLAMGELRKVPFGVPLVTNETLGDHVSNRIYGGEEAPLGKFPFMVLVLIQDKYGQLHTCSGSLVAKNWVLLAGQCVLDDVTADDFILLGGATDLGKYLDSRVGKPFDEVIKDSQFGVEERRASAVYVHPDYDKETHIYDVALLRLKTPFTDAVKVQNITSEKKLRFKDCVILGWGLNDFNLFDGKLLYREKVAVNSPFFGCLTETSGPVFCVERGPSGICQGDSGGPLVCDGLTRGVASYFVTQPEEPTCIHAVESFYTNIYFCQDWINSHISGGSKLTIVSANSMIVFTTLAYLALNF